MTDTVRAQNIQVNKVNHDKLKKKESGAKNVWMKYDTNSRFKIQIDRVSIPYGVSCWDKDPDNLKYSLIMPLEGNPKMDKFRNVLELMDENNIQHCISNSKAWWPPKGMSEGTIREAGYSPMVKPVTNKESGEIDESRPPRFKVKLPMYKGKPGFRVFGKDREEINFWTAKKIDEETTEYDVDWSWATNGMEVKLLVECEGLWVVDRNVYCTWRCTHVCILKDGQNSNYAFLPDDDEEEDEEEEEEESTGEEDEDDEAYESE